MAPHEAEAVLIEAVGHLRRALALLDGAGLKRPAGAQISHALEDLRQEIHLLRMADQPAPPRGGRPARHALG